MTELLLLEILLIIAFVLAPLMTNAFFLSGSRIYSDAHKVTLLILAAGAALDLGVLAFAWPLFCAFGFFLHLRTSSKTIVSVEGFATCLPFVFSLISSTWFVAGVNDLQLLGYDKPWSYYAALHGSFLGWLVVGCFAFLAKRPGSSRLYLWGCYLTFVFFLLIAFGIDGTPFIKRIGVVGLSVIVPSLIGLHAIESKNRTTAFRISVLSLVSIVVTMGLALSNEFWAAAPRVTFGLPTMVLIHGLMNAVLTVPGFYLAIRYGLEKVTSAATAGENVVFFDGVCVLCNGTVDLLVKADKKRIFRYTSLQGKYAREALDSRHVDSVSSVILRSGGVVYEKSEAVIQILWKLGGIYGASSLVASVIPLFILDMLYDFVARNRYHVFGRTDSCSIPADEDKHLFIP